MTVEAGLLPLRVADDHLLGMVLQLMDLGPAEARIPEHLFKLREWVRVTGRRTGQHHHREGGGNRRRYTVRVRNEFQRDHAAARFQCGVSFLQYRIDGRRIEVMKEV